MADENAQDGTLRHDLAFAYRVYNPANPACGCLLLRPGSGVGGRTVGARGGIAPAQSIWRTCRCGTGAAGTGAHGPHAALSA